MKAAFGSALLAAACAAGLASSAAAQNTYQQQITRQLTRYAQRLTTAGYNADRAPAMGSLNDDARESLMMNLTGGVHYAILGVCDNDCTDVDLRVNDPSGSLMGEDLATDDYPVVEFTAPASGQFRVTVMMATCNVNPCYYGVQVFVRGGGGGGK